MRAWRITTVVVIVALVVSAAVLERRDDLRAGRAGASLDQFSLAKLMPTAARPGATGSVWFCAAGTATGRDDGLAEHTVVVANGSAVPVSGTLTAFPDTGEPVSRHIEVGPFSRIGVEVAGIITAEHAAVLVELSGGEAAVEHLLRGPDGQGVAACSSTSSNRWYVPAGSTTPGSREILAIFNPFPEDASVDLAFETEDGRRTPEKYSNLLVRGSAVTPVDITDVVTVRRQVAALVTVGSGRVVVDHLQIFDGSEGHPRGLSVSPGAPAPHPRWYLPDVPGARDGLDQSVVVLDPGPSGAEIEIQVREASTGRTVEPYDAEVRGEQYTEVAVMSDGRVRAGEAASLAVLSTNQVPVVVSHVIRTASPDHTDGSRGDAGGGVGLASGERVRGVSYLLGSPLLARRWLVPAAALAGASEEAVIVANPTAEDVTLTVNALRRGSSGPVEGYDERTVPAGARLTVDVGLLDDEEVSIEVVATGPVVVQHRLQFGEPDDVAVAIAIPVDGSLVDLPIEPVIEIDLDLTPEGTDLPPGIDLPVPVPDTGSGPDGTSPDGSLPAAGPGTDLSSSSTSTVAPAAPPAVPDPGGTPGGPVGPPGGQVTTAGPAPAPSAGPG